MAGLGSIGLKAKIGRINYALSQRPYISLDSSLDTMRNEVGLLSRARENLRPS